MALYVDSAYIDDITHVAQIVPLAGVTTNPTLLLAARDRGQMLEPQFILQALLHKLEGGVFMQPGMMDEENMYQQARAYVQTAPDRIIAKIPMTSTGMKVARRLKAENHRLAFTAVTTVAQAYTAAMVEADFVIPYYNRLVRAGVDANIRIAEMAELLRNQKHSTRILAASIKSPLEAVSALSAGAHDITAAPQVLLNMVSDAQTDEAVEKFAQDWQKINKV
ncbi:MAG: fructose-6-phosphate aldolase [Ktedonobacteraceae bacterium]